MTVQFYLRNPDSTTASALYLQVRVGGQRLRLTTGEKCLPAQWDERKEQFRRSYPGYQEANELLAALAARLTEAHRRQRAEGGTPTPASLKAALAPAAAPVVREQNLVVLMSEFREVLRGRGYMRDTLRHYLVVGNWLRDFALHRRRPLLAESYSLVEHDALLHYLTLTRELAPNSVYTLVKNLKALFNYLQQERGYALALKVASLKATSVDVEKVYLTAGELEQLRTAVLPSTLVPVRDVFLFCCYTGLRYSDVLQLHGGNLENLPDGSGRVLRFTQTKTRTKVSVYLTVAATALLEKYAAAERSGKGGRLLPVYQNQVMNRYLKRLARLAGLEREVEQAAVVSGLVRKQAVALHELVTMHTARHTFATQSLLRGMPVEILQKVLGHANIKTTLICAKVVEDFQHQTMRRIWDGQGATDTSAGLDSQICAVESAA
ncbi:tyrosine-type recombinase/integrase [Hymenobacter rubripertinctus]|uniref:Tyr recombinase domain-containing protein n=1 Tax=Hymenobacter rubripertinctus TaxID=2029981 RepID=A0A418R8Y3_9BACT|nr:tyrosine-type recombinase/integrase [Hymenobacter rubripertinctus]RIY13751.1 hypothetical protein D0T11_01325 [Hymenobacter rubripertinctus]